MMNFQKTIIASVVAATIFSGVAFSATPVNGPAEGGVIAALAAETSTVIGGITTLGVTIAGQMQIQFERTISAIAIATKQEALSANLVADNSRETAQVFVSAVRAQQDSDQVVKALVSFNPKTGQGYDPCGTTARNASMDRAFAKVADNAAANIGLIDVAPGRLVNSPDKTMQARLEKHRSKFCTTSEANAGLCSASQLPGGDTNAALLFESVPSGSLKSEARMAFISHVIGEPDAKLSPAEGSTAAGQVYLAAKNRKDALLSIPAYSLAMIDEANKQTPNNMNHSPNEMLKLRVNQYFGGAEAKVWTKSLSVQSDRGLLIETAKMAGLEAWIHHKQYEQNQRLEANLAALVLASAERLSDPLAAKYEKTLALAVKSAIK